MSRLANAAYGLKEYYFNPEVDPFLGEYDGLFDKALWPFLLWIPAFLTIGIENITLFGISIPALFFIMGIAGFALMVVAHFILFILGSFYKRGIFTTIGYGIGGTLALIALALALGFVLYGGIFIGAAIFLWLLPMDTPLVPLNIIAWLVVAIWWYAKGIEIVDSDQSLEQVFRSEIKLLKKHGIIS